MNDPLQGARPEAVPRDRALSRDELCVHCHIDAVLLDALVEHGVLEIDGPDGFREIHVVRVTRAVRVMHEFDVGVDSLALVIDLLDRLAAQRRELSILRRLAPPD